MSRLSVSPPTCEVPASGGYTQYELKCTGDERICFKIRIKAGLYSVYKVRPVVGFVQPTGTKTLTIHRLPGKPSKDRLQIQYIVAPQEYDPRNPFPKDAKVRYLPIEIHATSISDSPESGAEGGRRISGKSKSITRATTKSGEIEKRPAGKKIVKSHKKDKSSAPEVRKDANRATGKSDSAKIEKGTSNKKTSRSALSKGKNKHKAKKDGKRDAKPAADENMHTPAVQIRKPNADHDDHIKSNQHFIVHTAEGGTLKRAVEEHDKQEAPAQKVETKDRSMEGHGSTGESTADASIPNPHASSESPLVTSTYMPVHPELEETTAPAAVVKNNQVEERKDIKAAPVPPEANDAVDVQEDSVYFPVYQGYTTWTK